MHGSPGGKHCGDSPIPGTIGMTRPGGLWNRCGTQQLCRQDDILVGMQTSVLLGDAKCSAMLDIFARQPLTIPDLAGSCDIFPASTGGRGTHRI